ncbi:UNVERIFIED_CONTAM: hypothetical protein GTU68_047697 [Idotea baltica]|nr:hypothetical protein [Idotea baltica]
MKPLEILHKILFQKHFLQNYPKITNALCVKLLKVILKK